MEAKVRWAGMTLQMIQKPLRTHCKNRSRNELRITGEEKPHRHGEVQSQLQSLRLHAMPGSQEVVSTFHVDAPPEMPCLAGGGGGIFFFWQLGAVEYLAEHYDLKSVQFVGASAGALVATLGACGVSPEVAVACAYRLSNEERLWDRKLGLLGIWGGLVRRWLQEILPDTAHEISGGRLKLVVTDVVGRRQVYLQNFETKDDLINSCMASIHIPFFLDFGPFSFYKGRAYVDGSLSDFLFWENSKLLTLDGRSFVLDYSRDVDLKFGRLDFVKLRSYESVMELMAQGRRYAAAVDAAGGFQQYLGGVKLKGAPETL